MGAQRYGVYRKHWIEKPRSENPNKLKIREVRVNRVETGGVNLLRWGERILEKSEKDEARRDSS